MQRGMPGGKVQAVVHIVDAAAAVAGHIAAVGAAGQVEPIGRWCYFARDTSAAAVVVATKVQKKQCYGGSASGSARTAFAKEVTARGPVERVMHIAPQAAIVKGSRRALKQVVDTGAS